MIILAAILDFHKIDVLVKADFITWYDFCLQSLHAIFIARAARVMEKLYTISMT